MCICIPAHVHNAMRHNDGLHILCNPFAERGAKERDQNPGLMVVVVLREQHCFPTSCPLQLLTTSPTATSGNNKAGRLCVIDAGGGQGVSAKTC